MQLGQTTQYKDAIVALNSLRDQYGSLPELKTIALFLFYANTNELTPSMFAWVGTNDPRDRAVVAAIEEAFRLFVNDDDDLQNL